MAISLLLFFITIASGYVITHRKKSCLIHRNNELWRLETAGFNERFAGNVPPAIKRTDNFENAAGLLLLKTDKRRLNT